MATHFLEPYHGLKVNLHILGGRRISFFGKGEGGGEGCCFIFFPPYRLNATVLFTQISFPPDYLLISLQCGGDKAAAQRSAERPAAAPRWARRGGAVRGASMPAARGGSAAGLQPPRSPAVLLAPEGRLALCLRIPD